MSGAASCKAEAIAVLARRCTCLRYNDLGFGFGSCLVFLWNAVRSVRFQVSCFQVCWPDSALEASPHPCL